MSRDTNDAVTVSTLIPVQSENGEGRAFVPVEEEDEDGRPEINYIPRTVRRFTQADLGKTKRGAETLKQVGKYQHLLTLVEYLRAERDDDAVAAKNAYEKHLKETRSPLVQLVARRMMEKPGVSPRAFARDSIEHTICRSIESVRLVIWQREGKLAPGLFCPDVSLAFLVHALMSALGPKGNVGLRLCPKCSGPFLQKRKDQSYCSIRCREAHRVQRFRARKKARDSRKARATDSEMQGGKK